MLMKWEKIYNMELNEFLEYANGGNVLYAGSDIHKFMHILSDDAQKITDKINNRYNTHEEKIALISELVGEKVDDSFNLFPPIYTDCGKNIHFGKNNFVNSGCCFQDQGGIYFGDNVLVGHQVVFATLNHMEAPEKRGSMIPKAIHIGNNVWIGSHATILGGVTIGENCIIAAGAVVTKDVPANTVVAGVPAKVLREIAND